MDSFLYEDGQVQISDGLQRTWIWYNNQIPSFSVTNSLITNVSLSLQTLHRVHQGGFYGLITHG